MQAIHAYTSAEINHHGVPNEERHPAHRGLAEDGALPTFVTHQNTKPVQTFIVDETKQYMDGIIPEDDDSDGGEKSTAERKHAITNNSKKTRGRVKIKMEFIQNKLRRYTTFSKRKTGIMKKAYELSTLTGTQVMLLVASETGHVYTFATRKLQPMITSESGKALIQTCLNSPDPAPAPVLHQSIQQNHMETVTQSINQEVNHNMQNQQSETANEQRMSETGYEEPDLQYQNSEEESKNSQNTATNTPTIQYVTQAQQSFPINTYISSQSGNKPVQVGSITTIFTAAPPTPEGGSNNSGSTTTNIQPQQQSTVHAPQILSGQLQLHRIHPQNILLTGNSTIPQNHIILNPSASQQTLVVNNGSPAPSNHRPETTSSNQQHQDVITFVNPGQSSAGQILQVYNASTGVIYAQQTHNGGFKRINENSEQLTMQHTPVIQASSDMQQGTSVVISRQQLEADGLVVPRNTGNLSK